MQNFYSSPDNDLHTTLNSSCPIARIEAERKRSPMALLVRHTNQAPSFAGA
jgi:hypothetical protein